MGFHRPLLGARRGLETSTVLVVILISVPNKKNLRPDLPLLSDVPYLLARLIISHTLGRE